MFSADRLLRRQWKAIARVEGPSPRHVLATTSSRRAATHHSSATVAPLGAATQSVNLLFQDVGIVATSLLQRGNISMNAEIMLDGNDHFDKH